MTKQGQRMNERMREALLHTPAYPCYCFAYAKTTNVLDRLRANTQCHHRWFSYSSTRHRHLDESRAKRDLTNIKASQAELNEQRNVYMILKSKKQAHFQKRHLLCKLCLATTQKMNSASVTHVLADRFQIVCIPIGYLSRSFQSIRWEHYQRFLGFESNSGRLLSRSHKKKQDWKIETTNKKCTHTLCARTHRRKPLLTNQTFVYRPPTDQGTRKVILI